MTVKRLLVFMTVAGVVSDSLLHPFYPQYLQRVFGVTDPKHVGAYVGASSLTVLAALPLWALVSRRIPVLKLLIATQVATGALSLVASCAPTLTCFYVSSLGMLCFKASYLLIYPHVLSLEPAEEHLGTIGLLAFVVYFSNILAALLSGLMLELFEPTLLFVAMAAGDAIQLALCVFLLRVPAPDSHADPASEPDDPPPPAFAYKLGAVMLVMYFSAYLCEPFFSSYWEQLAPNSNPAVTGCVFAIPGAAALLGLYVNARRGADEAPAFKAILPAVALCVCSLWLQALGSPLLLLAARFAYGWGLFQVMVRLDALLFRASRKERYATEFSRINLFQGVGVLFASFSAGSLVSMFGVRVTFLVAAAGFLCGGLLFCTLFRHALWPRSRELGPEGSLHEVV